MSDTLSRTQTTEPRKKLPPKYDAVRYIMAMADEDQYDGFAGERGLERLAQMPLELRLKRLERRERETFHHLCEVIQEAIARANISDTERDKLKEEPLPEISDRRSFSLYVAAVTRRLHQKLITGQEARALLYAAQLALAGLKGGSHD